MANKLITITDEEREQLKKANAKAKAGVTLEPVGGVRALARIPEPDVNNNIGDALAHAGKSGWNNITHDATSGLLNIGEKATDFVGADKANDVITNLLRQTAADKAEDQAKINEQYGQFGGVADTVNEVATAGVSMLPQVGAFLLTPSGKVKVGTTAMKWLAKGLQAAPSTAVLGVNSMGSGINKALNEGAELEDAQDYGMLNAGKEIITGLPFAGVKYLPGLKNVGQTVAGKVANETAKKIAGNAANMATEGAEEAAAEIIDPFIQRATYNENAKLDWNDVIHSAMIGALTTGAINASGTAVEKGVNALPNAQKVQQKHQNRAFEALHGQKIGQKMTDSPETAQNRPEQAQDIPMTENPRSMENVAQEQTSQAVFEQKPVENIQNQKPVENAPKDTLEMETVAKKATVEDSSKVDSEPSGQSNRKVSQFYTNTMQKTPLFTEAERNLFEASEYEYDVVSEKESIRKATERLEADYEGTKKELQEKEMLTGDDVDAAMFFVQEGLEAGRETGDYSKAKAWTKKIQESATVEGRAVQALAKYSRTTAEGLMVQAQKYVKQSEDALKTTKVGPVVNGKRIGVEKDSATWRKVEAETEQATKAIEEAETKAAESANAELKKRVREYKAKHYRTNPNPTAKPEPDFGDKLYKKVLDGANLELEEKGALTGKQIVDELYQKLKENGMPDYRGHRGKRNYTSLEYLKDAVQHKAEYADVFAKTQEYMKAEYGNDPEVLQLINEALNGNFSTLKLDAVYSRKTVEKAVKETADLFGIDLKEIIKQSQGKKDEAAQVIKNHIMQYTDVPDADAAQLANDVVDVYCGELKRLTEERLNQLFPKEVKQQEKRKRTAFDDLLELINMGAYDRQDIVDAIKQKNNLPVLTNADIKIIQENVEAANQYERYSYEWKKHMAKAQQVAADKMPQATKSKITQLKRLMMLSNPRTDVRNVTGNVPLAGTEIMSDVIGSFVDKGLSKVRGTDRTTTANPHLVEFMKGFGAGVKDTVKDIRNDVNTYRMDEEATTQYELPKGRTFQNTTGGIRGGINDFLNGMDKIVNYGLMFGDRPFFEAHYAKRMAQLKDLGYDVEAKETKADAYAYAVDMVFQSDSNMAQGARNLREGLNKFCTINGFALGDFVLPFVQTPANIADKLLDYSPVVFVKAWGQVKNSKTEAFDQRLFCQRIGRACTGVAILGIARALAEAGIITGGSDDNAEKRNAMTAAGWKPYSFYIDGKYYDYSYIQPVGMLLAMVADAYQEGQSAEDLSDWVDIAGAGVKGGVDCFLNMSFFSSLTDFFGGYGSNAENIFTALLDFPTQFAPAIVNAANKSIDPYQRETYDSDPIKRTINKFIAKTPASQTLPKKLDVYGNEMMQNQGRDVIKRTIENMLIPSTVSERKADALNDELLRLNDDTGKKEQFLSYPDKKQDLGNAGEYKLDGEERNEFIKNANGYAAEQMNKLIQTDAYKALDDFAKIKVLGNIEEYANYLARQKLAESHNKEYIDKDFEKIKKSGVEPYQYFVLTNSMNNINGKGEKSNRISYLEEQKKAGTINDEQYWFMRMTKAGTPSKVDIAECPYEWIKAMYQ